MAYVKPGVDVTRIQKTQTPILTTPDLEACVVGNGYWIQDITWDNPGDKLHHSIAMDYTKDPVEPLYFSGQALTVELKDHVNSTYYDIASGDEELVIVDLQGVQGTSTGVVKHLVYGTDYSVATNAVTLSGTTGDNTKYLVKVGYRAKNINAYGFNKIVSADDIRQTIGEPVSWNPLAYGANITLANAARSINVLGVEYAADAGTKAIDAINNVLSTKEVYAIAPVTHNVTAAELKAHCETYSAPLKKKERIAFFNAVVGYLKDPSTMTASERATQAGTIRDNNSKLGSQRLFSIHPDAAYVLETRHISSIKPSWIEKSFDYFTTMSFTTYGPYAKLISDVTINGVRYKAGTDITDTVYAALVSANYGGASGMITVLAPVPGFYFCAQAAGQVIGTTPDQPLTNVPGTGLARTYGSQDVFSEDDLNTMAEGGTWIMTQDSPTGPIYSRHQMSTDITSIAKREMSITKAVDYTSKFVRKALSPFIGAYNITPAFLKLVETVLVGTGLYLIREGVLNDFKVVSVTQDEINPDTIRCEINILVKYPVNYIKVTLTF